MKLRTLTSFTRLNSIGCSYESKKIGGDSVVKAIASCFNPRVVSPNPVPCNKFVPFKDLCIKI